MDDSSFETDGYNETGVPTLKVSRRPRAAWSFSPAGCSAFTWGTPHEIRNEKQRPASKRLHRPRPRKVRPERWNKVANTVYVETPAMTGFSYCDDDDCAWNDETTADAHYQVGGGRGPCRHFSPLAPPSSLYGASPCRDRTRQRKMAVWPAAAVFDPVRR
jgi:hypothetical protein